jgi:hypothetical protein
LRIGLRLFDSGIRSAELGLLLTVVESRQNSTAEWIANQLMAA